MSSEFEFQVANSTSPSSPIYKGRVDSIQNHPPSPTSDLIIGLEDAIDQTGSYIYIKDLSGRYVYANKKVRNLFDAPLNEIVGKDDSLFFNYSVDNELRNDDLRVLAHGETIEKEETLWVKSIDEKRIFLVVKKPIINHDGLVIGLCGVSTDITEIKRTNEALRKSEELYRKTFQTSLDAININRMEDGVYINVNDAFLTILGFARDEVIGISTLDLNIWADNSDRKRLVETLQRNSACPNFEARFRCKNGNIIWGLMSASIILVDNEPCILSITRDITQRKSMEIDLLEREIALNKAQQVSHVGSWSWYTKTNRLEWSDEMFRIFGINKENFNGDLNNVISNAIHPDDRAKVEQSNSSVITNAKPIPLEYRVIRPDGTVRTVWAEAGDAMKDESGNIIILTGIVQDITERKQADIVMRQYKKALETTHDGYWMLNSNGFLQVANQAYADISGYSVEELQGMHITQLEGKEKTEAETKAHIEKIINQGYELFETRHRHKDGHLIDIEVSTSFIPELQQFVAFCRDITERKAAEEKIEHLAFYDPLTHFPNLNLLLSRLQKNIEGTRNQLKFNAILLINIDDFKSLNDFKGREVGDLFLIEITDHLKSSVHSTDIIARIGGDEFVVVIDLLSDEIEAATSESKAVADRILKKINQPLDLRGHAYHCTVSIGITLFRTDEFTAQQLLKQADVAMHQSKRHGRNTISFFDPATEIELESRVKLESWMHSALNGQYRLHYQIQVDVDGNATGAEALIRWQHPEEGMIYPVKFIPLAEETGLIIPIGEWVLKSACLQLKAWQDDPKFKHMVIAVNVSAKQFHQPDFATQVLTVLDQTGVDADKLKLELTESIFVENVDDLIGKMNLLKSRGVRFSLDDFGTGYSSLSILKRLPLNQLKIDQSFVRNLLKDPNDAAIIRTVIALGQSFGVEVIAEGVETIEQRNFLAVYGCHYFQGYLFSKPLPLDEFEALIQ